MVQRVTTVAFEGIEARAVDVQVQVAPGLPAFKKVGTINPGCGMGRYADQSQTPGLFVPSHVYRHAGQGG